MKAEFPGTLAPNGQITVPQDVACRIPQGEQLQVVLVWGDDAWRQAGRIRFEAAYAPEDSVYEELLDEPTTR